MTARFYGNGRVGAGRRDARRRSARGWRVHWAASRHTSGHTASILRDEFLRVCVRARARAYVAVCVCIRERPRTLARMCIYPPCHSRSPVLLSTLPFLLPDAHTRDRPLLSSRVRRDIPPILSVLLHLPFPPPPLSFLGRGEEKPVTMQHYPSFRLVTRRFQILGIWMDNNCLFRLVKYISMEMENNGTLIFS